MESLRTYLPSLFALLLMGLPPNGASAKKTPEKKTVEIFGESTSPYHFEGNIRINNLTENRCAIYNAHYPVAYGTACLITANITATGETCLGDSDGSASASSPDGMMPYTYDWSDGQNTAIATGLAAGTYTVTITDTNGCTGTAEAVIAAGAEVAAYAGEDQAICDGGIATLTATGGTNYVWSTAEAAASITVNPMTTTTYTVTVTNAAGCSDTDEVMVSVGALPNAGAGEDQSICEGESATLTATGGDTYVWNTGENTASITVSSGGTYIVTISNNNGCSVVDDVVVAVNPLPNADAGDDVVICPSESATLTATGGVAYAWSTGENTASITVTPDPFGTYTVTVTDGNGCVNTDEVVVETAPPTAINISGANNAMNETTEAYTVSPFLVSSTYDWTVTGGTLTGNGETVDVLWGTGNTGEICVTATNSDDCTGEQVCLTVDLFTSSTEEITALKGLKVYPNPTEGWLVVEANEASLSIGVYDALGREIRSLTGNNNRQVLDLSGLADGIYLLQVRFKEGNATQRVVLGL